MNENDYCIKFHDLQAAVIALYYSAYWHPDRQVDEAYLWTAVRDTADIAAGKTAARLGPDRTVRPEVALNMHPTERMRHAVLAELTTPGFETFSLPERANILCLAVIHASMVKTPPSPQQEHKE